MDLVARMKGPRPLLWDGGIGTALLAEGLDLSREAPETWLFSRPAQVQAVHEDFAAAGADVLQTDTFGLLRLSLAAGAAGQADGPPPAVRLPAPLQEVVARAVALARRGAARAASGPADSLLVPEGRSRAQATAALPGPPAEAPEVIASLGPSGLPRPDPEGIEEACARIAALFQAEGVRALHLETFYDTEELRAAIRGVRAGAPGMALIASITLSVGNSGLETPLGIPLARILRVMETEGPDVVGTNCSQTARRMRASVAALREWSRGRVPLLAQPQLGPFGPECKRSTPLETPEQFVHGLMNLLEDGADAVGGCCGCQGRHLRAMRLALGAGAAPREIVRNG